jgi:hypothetical protein
MVESSGSFTGRVRISNSMWLADAPYHQLEMAEVTGSHHSSDEKWDDAKVTYWGLADVIEGNGTQQGYYVNEHPDGGREFGKFQGKITTSQGETTVEGTWQVTDGTGLYSGMKGDGKYKMTLISPMEVMCSWQGQYELATVAQAA